MTRAYSTAVEAGLKRRVKRFANANDPPFSRDTANRAFSLLHGIHPDRTTAARLVLHALSDFPAVWKGTGRIIKSEEANMQAYLFAVSDKWERDQESQKDPSNRKYRDNIYCPTPEDLLVRYVKLLVSRSIEEGPFYATVGLAQHLYRHAPLTHMEKLIERIVPLGSYPNSFGKMWRTLEECINRTAGYLASSLKKRFPTTYDTIAWHVPSPQEAKFISNTLEHLKPWGTVCLKSDASVLDLVPEGTASTTRNLKRERALVHALIDTGCAGFNKLVQDYSNEYASVAVWDVTSPRFPGSTPTESEEGGFDRFNPEPLSDTEVHLIQDACSIAHLRRRHFRASVLEICADGRKVSQIDPLEDPSASFHVSPLASYLEVYGQDHKTSCLLAAFPLHGLREGNGLQLKLAGGQRLRLEVKVSETTGTFELRLTYQDTAFLSSGILLRDVRDRWRWMKSWFQLRWVPVGSTVLLLVLLFGFLWQERNNIYKPGETLLRGKELQTHRTRFELTFKEQTAETIKLDLVERIDGTIISEIMDKGFQIVTVDSTAAAEDVVRILAKQGHILEKYERENLP